MSSQVTVSSFVRVFSFLSGASLVFFGLASVLVSVVTGGSAGVLIGVALTAHGVYELFQRKPLISGGSMVAAKKLAWNQGALAGSVTLYLGWQMMSIDAGEIKAIFSRDPLRSMLDQMPAGTGEQFTTELPRLLVTFYGLSVMVVLLGCVGMAMMYLRSVED